MFHLFCTWLMAAISIQLRCSTLLAGFQITTYTKRNNLKPTESEKLKLTCCICMQNNQLIIQFTAVILTCVIWLWQDTQIIHTYPHKRSAVWTWRFDPRSRGDIGANSNAWLLLRSSRMKSSWLVKELRVCPVWKKAANYFYSKEQVYTAGKCKCELAHNNNACYLHILKRR